MLNLSPNTELNELVTRLSSMQSDITKKRQGEGAGNKPGKDDDPIANMVSDLDVLLGRKEQPPAPQQKQGQPPAKEEPKGPPEQSKAQDGENFKIPPTTKLKNVKTGEVMDFANFEIVTEPMGAKDQVTTEEIRKTLDKPYVKTFAEEQEEGKKKAPTVEQPSDYLSFENITKEKEEPTPSSFKEGFDRLWNIGKSLVAGNLDEAFSYAKLTSEEERLLHPLESFKNAFEEISGTKLNQETFDKLLDDKWYFDFFSPLQKTLDNLTGFDKENKTARQRAFLHALYGTGEGIFNIVARKFIVGDMLLREVPNAQFLSDAIMLPFHLSGELGKFVYNYGADMLGMKPEDPEVNQLSEEIAGMIGMLTVPIAVGKLAGLRNKTKEKIEALEQKTPENITNVIKSDIYENIIKPELNKYNTAKEFYEAKEKGESVKELQERLKLTDEQVLEYIKDDNFAAHQERTGLRLPFILPSKNRVEAFMEAKKQQPQLPERTQPGFEVDQQGNVRPLERQLSGKEVNAMTEAKALESVDLMTKELTLDTPPQGVIVPEYTPMSIVTRLPKEMGVEAIGDPQTKVTVQRMEDLFSKAEKENAPIDIESLRVELDKIPAELPNGKPNIGRSRAEYLVEAAKEYNEYYSSKGRKDFYSDPVERQKAIVDRTSKYYDNQITKLRNKIKQEQVNGRDTKELERELDRTVKQSQEDMRELEELQRPKETVYEKQENGEYVEKKPVENPLRSEEELKNTYQQYGTQGGSAVFQYQDSIPERVVHGFGNNPKWEKGNHFRYILEGAGDILRELSIRGDIPKYFEPSYLKEKINRIQNYLANQLWGLNGGEYSREFSLQHNKKNFKAYEEAYEKQPTATVEQELARQLNLDLVRGDWEAARIKLDKLEEFAQAPKEQTPKKPVEQISAELDFESRMKQAQQTREQKYAENKQIITDALQRGMGGQALSDLTFGLSGLAKELGNPKVVRALYEAGQYHFENGVTKFKDWAAKMKEQFGEVVEPVLQKLWDSVSARYNDITTTRISEEFKERVDKAIEKDTEYTRMSKELKHAIDMQSKLIARVNKLQAENTLKSLTEATKVFAEFEEYSKLELKLNNEMALREASIYNQIAWENVQDMPRYIQTVYRGEKGKQVGPTDYGWYGKGEYWSKTLEVAKDYMGKKTGKLRVGKVELKNPFYARGRAEIAQVVAPIIETIFKKRSELGKVFDVTTTKQELVSGYGDFVPTKHSDLKGDTLQELRSELIRDTLQQAGYDGIVYWGGSEVVVFEPKTSIKSEINLKPEVAEYFSRRVFDEGVGKGTYNIGPGTILGSGPNYMALHKTASNLLMKVKGEKDIPTVERAIQQAKEYLIDKQVVQEAISSPGMDMMGLSKLADITQPRVLEALYGIGKFHIENGLTKVKDWGNAMVKDLGQWIAKHLDELWKGVKKWATTEHVYTGSKNLNKGLSSNLPAPKGEMEFIREQVKSGKSLKDSYTEWEKYTKGLVQGLMESEGLPRPVGVIRNIKTEKDTGFTEKQRIVFETVNRFEPFKRYAREQKGEETMVDPTLDAFSHINKNSIATTWVKGDNTVTFQKDGNYKIESGSIKTYLQKIKNQTAKFDEYLVSRRVMSDIKRLESLNHEVTELNKKYPAEFEKVVNAGDKLKEQAAFEELKGLEKEIATALKERDELVDVIKNDGFAFSLADTGGAVHPEAVEFRGYTVNKKTMEAYEKGNEKFAEAVKMYDEVNQRLLNFAENTGLISKERADILRKREGYAAFQRFIPELENFNFVNTIPSAQIKSLKSRTGGAQEIISPVYSQVKAVVEVIGKGLENNIWNKLEKLAQENEGLRERFKEDAQGNFRFKVDGETKTYNAAPELMAVAKNFRPQEMDLFVKLIQFPASVFTRLTTSANPMFMLANFPVDQITFAMNTKTGGKPLIDPLLTLLHAIKGTENWQKYVEMGGKKQTMSSYLKMEPERLTEQLAGEKPTVYEKAKGVADALLGVLEIPSNMSEMMTRFAEFRRAKEQGKTDTEAMYMASQVTIPFQLQGNYWGKFLTAWIKSVPYMNANFQAAYKFMRQAREHPIRVATVGAAVMASSVSTVLAALLYASDEQKRLLGNFQAKEFARAIFIPHPNGKEWLRFRIPEQLGAFSGMIYLWGIGNVLNGPKASFEDYLKSLSSFFPQQVNPVSLMTGELDQVFMSWAPAAIKPTAEVIVNRKTYPETLPIVPDYMKYTETTQQYTEYTSEVAKLLSQLFVKLPPTKKFASPILIDHWLKGQFGAIGNAITSPSRYWDNKPLVRQEDRFIMSGRSFNNFYEEKDEVDRLYTNHKDDTELTMDQRKDIMDNHTMFSRVARILADARTVVAQTRDLPENTRESIFELLLDISNKKSPKELNERIDLLQADVEGIMIEHDVKGKGETDQERLAKYRTATNMLRGLEEQVFDGSGELKHDVLREMDKIIKDVGDAKEPAPLIKAQRRMERIKALLLAEDAPHKREMLQKEYVELEAKIEELKQAPEYQEIEEYRKIKSAVTKYKGQLLLPENVLR